MNDEFSNFPDEDEKSLFNFHSLQEINENFSLTELFHFAKKNNLAEWLESNFYSAEGKKISEAIKKNFSDSELKLLICKIFSCDFEKLSESELEEISELIAKNQRKKLFFDEHEDNERKIVLVENQRELIQGLRDGAEIFYLFGAEFKIPIDYRGKVYIGRNNAIIDLDFDSDIDFDEREIIFEDLQIFLHYPITLKMEKSRNVKIIDGAKKFLGTHPTLKEMLKIMQGRGAFESAENFAKRAEDIRGAAVGKVLLEDKNYFFDDAKFKIRPQWDFEYISVLKNFLHGGREFFVNISPEKAELLYTNERKLQIFADLAYIDGKLTILNLYFDTKILGRIFIENILRELKNKFSSGSSGFGGLGYGLHIITDYISGK